MRAKRFHSDGGGRPHATWQVCEQAAPSVGQFAFAQFRPAERRHGRCGAPHAAAGRIGAGPAVVAASAGNRLDRAARSRHWVARIPVCTSNNIRPYAAHTRTTGTTARDGALTRAAPTRRQRGRRPLPTHRAPRPAPAQRRGGAVAVRPRPVGCGEMRCARGDARREPPPQHRVARRRRRCAPPCATLRSTTRTRRGRAATRDTPPLARSSARWRARAAGARAACRRGRRGSASQWRRAGALSPRRVIPHSSSPLPRASTCGYT